MKLNLYKYELEKDALLIIDQEMNIQDINNEAREFFGIVGDIIHEENLALIKKTLGIGNFTEYISLALRDSFELTLDINGNKRALLKSEDVSGKRIVSILVSTKRDKSLNTLIESYLNSDKEAIIYYDEILNQLNVTQSFLDYFDIVYTDNLSFTSFLRAVLKNTENKREVINLISNKLYKYDEFLGVLKLISGQKIEFIYKRYEFAEDIKGILCNFNPIDREIPKINYDHTAELLEKKVLLEEMDFLVKNSYNTTKKMALFVINIDEFKNVNDLYGMKMGDFVLKKVAKRLVKATRTQDIVGRFSADEFLVLINDYEREEDLDKIATRMLKKISLPIKLVNRSVYINSTIGISSCNTDNIEVLLTNALSALKYGKKSQTKISYYNSYIERLNKEKLELEEEVKEAIKNKDFVVHYQPQISSRNNGIIGVEALVRWKHKTKGILAPKVFIPVAEELNLIKDIETIVVEKALEETKQLRRDKGIKLAINISNKQFCNDEFLAMIEQKKENLFNLEFEITESTAIGNLEANLEVINLYKSLGISIAIDDFGVGYSSLSHLKKLPIDSIKIDKSFVDNIVNNKGDETLVKAVLLIADTLDLDVVAEGVENEEQLKKLIGLGCNYFQGFYFAKPCSIDELIKNIKKNRYKMK